MLFACENGQSGGSRRQNAAAVYHLCLHTRATSKQAFEAQCTEEQEQPGQFSTLSAQRLLPCLYLARLKGRR